MIGEPCGEPATQSLLGAFVLGRLDPAEVESTRTHLTECLSCRESLASLRTVAVALRLLQPADLADLADLDRAADADADADADPHGPAAAALGGTPRPAPVAPRRCRFDLLLAARDQRRPRPLPSARRG
ncbi:zf-HC2 domain-containing protein [Micromonospora sp. NBC_01813]|uniref:zf-HC2 domain-containing protein n=1 Tax=Micromonospora sp. NBC_01813 TaxID=2975988 RepID=UPI002DDAF97E|nr:zf-HC2 domain-containing protein [Micromonospora sp. NBC_01813]WSA07739.1 zf-HC2 domain-containing protein [Micromonospora sp. NBC_01813]